MSQTKTISEQIEERLKDHFDIIDLKVIDESQKHIGHSGYSDKGETHFRIKMTSPDFLSMSRLERQKTVHRLLADLLETKIHALSLQLKSEA